MSSKENRRKPFRLGRISSSDSPPSAAPTSQSTSVFSRWTKVASGRRNEKPEPPKSGPPSAIIPYNSPTASATTSVAIQKSLGDIAVDLSLSNLDALPDSVSETHQMPYLSQKSLPRKPVIPTATTSNAQPGRVQGAPDAISAPSFNTEQATIAKSLTVPSPPSEITSATPKSTSLPPSVSLSTSIFQDVKASSNATLKKKAQRSPTVGITSRAPAESTSAYPPAAPALLNPPNGIVASALNTDPNGIVIRVTTPASAQASRTSSKSTLLLNGGKPISLSTTLHQLKTSIAKLMELENVHLSRQKLVSSSKPCNCAFAESVARNGLWNMLRCRDHIEVACDYAHPDNPVLRKGICTLCQMDLVERCGDCQDAGIVTRDCCPLVVNAGCNHTFHHHCYTTQFGDTCPARCSTGHLSLILSILIY